MAPWSVAVLVLALSSMLTGCFGAYQVTADAPAGAGPLKPGVEDKDAGLVGIAGGFDLKTYPVIAVDVQSSQPVLVTADRRVAQMGFFGGDSKDHLKESFDDMARDLGKFLVRLSRSGRRTAPRSRR